MLCISYRENGDLMDNLSEKKWLSPIKWERTSLQQNGYRGPKQYDFLGRLQPHEVTYTVFKAYGIDRFWKPNPAATYSMDYSLQTPPIKIDDKGMTDDLARSVWSQLANQNTNLALLFKERQQTVDMVTGYVQDLIRYKKKFLKSIKKAYKHNDHNLLASKWLEYRYGWTPMLSDIENLVNKPLGHPSMRISGSLTRQAFIQFQHPNRADVEDYYVRINRKASCYITPRNVAQVTAQQYGISNLGLTAWELVPYSFVADWVLDVGGYLEHLGALSGLNVHSACNSLNAYHKSIIVVPANSNISKGTVIRTTKTGGRSLGLPSYPNPLVPSNGLNLNRFFDAAALLKGLFKEPRG